MVQVVKYKEEAIMINNRKQWEFINVFTNQLDEDISNFDLVVERGESAIQWLT